MSILNILENCLPGSRNKETKLVIRVCLKYTYKNLNKESLQILYKISTCQNTFLIVTILSPVVAFGFKDYKTALANLRRLKENVSKVLYGLQNQKKSWIIKLWKVQDQGRFTDPSSRNSWTFSCSDFRWQSLISPVYFMCPIAWRAEGVMLLWLIAPLGTHGIEEG